MHITWLDKVRTRHKLFAYGALLAAWLAGMIGGFFVYRSSEHVFVSMMCGSFRCSVSIVMLLTGVMLPYLITAYVVYFHKVYIVFPLCTCKAFLYTLAVASVYGTYGNGAWLMNMLVLFSENLSMCILISLWVRILSGSAVCRAAVFKYGGLALAVWGLDMVFVAPFVVSIMRF